MKGIRTIALLLLFAAVLVPAGPAAASMLFTQNKFTTGEVLDPGMTQSGIHFTLGDHYRNYYPEVRYGLGALLEVGLKFGVTSATVDNGGERIGALVGVDFKYQLIKETEGVPLDLSVDLGIDNTIIKKRNASETAFSTIVSKSFPLTDRGYKFTPYGGLQMASLRGSLPEETNISVMFLGGFEWKLSQRFMVLLELKGGPTAVGGAGIKFEY